MPANKPNPIVIAAIAVARSFIDAGLITADDLGLTVEEAPAEEAPKPKANNRRRKKTAEETEEAPKPKAKTRRTPGKGKAAATSSKTRKAAVKLTVHEAVYEGKTIFEIVGAGAASTKRISDEAVLKANGGPLPDNTRAKKHFFHEEDNQSLWAAGSGWDGVESVTAFLETAAETLGWNLTAEEGDFINYDE